MRNGSWLKTTSFTSVIFFFQKSILKVTWSQLCSKFFLSDYEAHLQQPFERYPADEYFPDMAQHTSKFFIKTLVNVMKRKSMKVPGKRSVAQNPIVHFGIFWIFSTQFTDLFAFWSTFDISLIMKFAQCLYAFLWGLVKFWWGSFLKVLTSKCSYNILILREKCLLVNDESYPWHSWI